MDVNLRDSIYNHQFNFYPTMKVNKGGIILTILLILAATAFSFYYHKLRTDIKKPKLAIVSGHGSQIRPFKFLDQDGDTVTNEAIKNKIVVVEYFFTTCLGICPVMNENMTKVYQAFKTNDDIMILSHTVDPKRDTVEAMKAYSQRFNVIDSKRWKFLTGSKKELYDQAYYSYLLNALENREENIDEDFIHSNLFVLVDRHGRLRMHVNKDGNTEAYDGTNEESVAQLIKDIQYLLTEDESI